MSASPSRKSSMAAMLLRCEPPRTTLGAPAARRSPPSRGDGRPRQWSGTRRWSCRSSTDSSHVPGWRHRGWQSTGHGPGKGRQSPGGSGRCTAWSWPPAGHEIFHLLVAQVVFAHVVLAGTSRERTGAGPASGPSPTGAVATNGCSTRAPNTLSVSGGHTSQRKCRRCSARVRPAALALAMPHASPAVSHAVALGVDVADRQRVEHGGDAGRDDLSVVAHAGRGRRPVRAAARGDVLLQVVGVQLDQPRQQVVALEVDARRATAGCRRSATSAIRPSRTTTWPSNGRVGEDDGGRSRIGVTDVGVHDEFRGRCPGDPRSRPRRAPLVVEDADERRAARSWPRGSVRRTTRRLAASSEAVGSSSSSRRGVTMKPRAMLTRCCSPPEKVAGGRSHKVGGMFRRPAGPRRAGLRLVASSVAAGAVAASSHARRASARAARAQELADEPGDVRRRTRSRAAGWPTQADAPPGRGRLGRSVPASGRSCRTASAASVTFAAARRTDQHDAFAGGRRAPCRRAPAATRRPRRCSVKAWRGRARPGAAGCIVVHGMAPPRRPAVWVYGCCGSSSTWSVSRSRRRDRDASPSYAARAGARRPGRG